MVGAGQGERGWGCRHRAAQRPPPPPPSPPGRGGGGGWGPLVPFPAFPTPPLRPPGPRLPAAVSASAALPLPFPRRRSQPPGDAAPTPAGLPTAALLHLSPRPSPLTAHTRAKLSTQPRPPAPSRRRGPETAPAARGVARREGRGVGCGPGRAALPEVKPRWAVGAISYFPLSGAEEGTGAAGLSFPQPRCWPGVWRVGVGRCGYLRDERGGRDGGRVLAEVWADPEQPLASHRQVKRWSEVIKLSLGKSRSASLRTQRAKHMASSWPLLGFSHWMCPLNSTALDRSCSRLPFRREERACRL